MRNFIPDESLPGPEPPSPNGTGHPTGPRTPPGKSISSQNALKHGCRSAKTVLAHEDPAEFEATLDAWVRAYAPKTEIALALVAQLTRAHWQLKRTQNQLDAIEFELPANPWDWTDAHHKQLALFTRYKTTAERSFLRYFKEIEAHHHRIHRDEDARRLALAKIADLELEPLSPSKQARIEQLRMDQVVEIEVLEGECVTSFYPSNEELIEDAAQHRAPPLYIARVLYFVDGVPPEYAWAHPAQPGSNNPPRVIQRMIWSDWLAAIECEKSTGHAGPIPPP